MRLNRDQRTTVFAAVKSDVQKFVASRKSEVENPERLACIIWSAYMVRALRRIGIPAQIQAGSAYWPMVSAEKDDGVSANRFGYEFDADSDVTRNMLLKGSLPELHAWVAIAEEPVEIIDPTSGYFKTNAESIGFEFSAEAPPECFWSDVETFPDLVEYRPDPAAIEIVYAFLNSVLGNKPLVLTLKV